jgi:hypothetical protein
LPFFDESKKIPDEGVVKVGMVGGGKQNLKI